MAKRPQPGFSPGRSKNRYAHAGIVLLTAIADPSATAKADQSGADQTVAILKRQDDAILRVGERLVVAGRQYCGGSGQSAGMTVQRIGQYGAAYRSAARRLLGVTELPTITALAAGGGASSSGLRVGDAIAAIDGHAFAPISQAQDKGSFDDTSTALDVIEGALADGRAMVAVVRDGRSLTLPLVPRPACRARFDVRAGRSNNASSDGTYVQVSSDLVDQARDDGELATILAHELAHNILHHPQQLTGPRPRPKVRNTEIEADRLSVYLLDAAGYPIGAAVNFWSRWGRANDYGVFADGSHPGWKQRVSAIEAEATAIAGQRAAGQPVHTPADLAPR